MLLVILLECKFCEDRDFVLVAHFLSLPPTLSPSYSSRGAEWPGEQPVRVFSLLFGWLCFFPNLCPASSQPSVLGPYLGEPRLRVQTVAHHHCSWIFQHVLPSVATAHFLCLRGLWLLRLSTSVLVSCYQMKEERRWIRVFVTCISPHSEASIPMFSKSDHSLD